MKIFFTILLFCLALSGCATPKYTATPIHEKISEKIVIINDRDTRVGFQDAVKGWVEKNNYEYVVVPDGSKHDLDKVTLEYEGNWQWDLALFLSAANINAYYKGQRIGEVVYEAPNNLNTNKFGNAAERIGYMMDILFGLKTLEEGNQLLNPAKNISK